MATAKKDPAGAIAGPMPRAESTGGRPSKEAQAKAACESVVRTIVVSTCLIDMADGAIIGAYRAELSARLFEAISPYPSLVNWMAESGTKASAPFGLLATVAPVAAAIAVNHGMLADGLLSVLDVKPEAVQAIEASRKLRAAKVAAPKSATAPAQGGA